MVVNVLLLVYAIVLPPGKERSVKYVSLQLWFSTIGSEPQSVIIISQGAGKSQVAVLASHSP